MRDFEIYEGLSKAEKVVNFSEEIGRPFIGLPVYLVYFHHAALYSTPNALKTASSALL